MQCIVWHVGSRDEIDGCGELMDGALVVSLMNSIEACLFMLLHNCDERYEQTCYEW
jgi:hypothetical protein